MKLLSLSMLSVLTLSVLAQSAPTIEYKLPEGWTASPEARPMRHATIMTPEKTEVVVTVFPGDVGGMLANVNRWRGQVGLQPIAEADIAKHTAQVKLADGTTATTMDFTGANGRILAASIPQKDRTWFIRSMGQVEPVGKTKAGFDAMVKSVTFK